jgi:hypothetical protein
LGKSHSREKGLDDYEHAIQTSINATSKGNPEEDAVIERALRASLRELQNAPEEGDKHSDEVYQSAIKASVQEYKKAHAEQGQETGVVSTAPEVHNHDEELERALTQSLEDYKKQTNGQPPKLPPRDETHWEDDSDSGVDTDYDEDFERAIEESKQLHTQNEQKKKDLSEREAALGENGNGTPVLPPAYSSSQGAHNDPELQRALTASSEEEQRRKDTLSKQKTEEEIVLEYVKKQSLLEEELRKKKEEAAAAKDAPPVTV